MSERCHLGRSAPRVLVFFADNEASKLLTECIVCYILCIVRFILGRSGDGLKLGNKLRQHRFSHDEITQQELANAVGVTRVTIHSVETGKFVPSTLLALKLARFFDVGVDDLFFLTNEE